MTAAASETFSPEPRGEVSRAFRHHLALSWSEMCRGELGSAAELLSYARTIVKSPRFEACDRVSSSTGVAASRSSRDR